MKKNNEDRITLKNLIFGNNRCNFKIGLLDLIISVSIALVFIILNESTKNVFKYSHLILALLVYFIGKLLYLSSIKQRKSKPK